MLGGYCSPLMDETVKEDMDASLNVEIVSEDGGGYAWPLMDETFDKTTKELPATVVRPARRRFEGA